MEMIYTREFIAQEVKNNFGVVLRRMSARGINIAGFTPNSTIDFLYQQVIAGRDIRTVIPYASNKDINYLKQIISAAVDRNYQAVKDAMYYRGYNVSGQDNNVIKITLLELAKTGVNITPFIDLRTVAARNGAV
jgi:hypothetical protein